MTLHNIFIIITVLIVLKFLSLFVVFILKVRYKYKAHISNIEDKLKLELCHVKKVTYLEFSNEYNELYLIPTVTIHFNQGIGITFYWFKIYYSSYWTIVKYKDEDEYVAFIEYKNNKKNS